MAPDALGALAVVSQVDGDAAAPADLQRLVPRREQPLGPQLPPRVRVVEAAVPSRLLRERDQLVGVGVLARRVVQAGREPPRALLHRLPHDRPHVLQLRGGGRTVVPAHAPDADGRVAQDVGHVDGDRPVVLAEQVGHSEPVGRHRRVAVEARVEPDVPVKLFLVLERGVRYSVYPHQLGGDALPHLRVVVRLAQDGEPGVGVQVDESGAHDHARSVDGARRVEARHVAAPDRHCIALDQHCCPEARAARAVDNLAVLYEKVEH